MTDLLEQASAWLDGMRQKHLAHAVAYCRGEQSVEVQATLGRTVFEIADAYGVVEQSESRDFLILACDLVLGGTQTLPERGDRIRETQDGKAFVYEVMAPGKEPHYRFSDVYRRT
ncbi:MAG: hypothetical protein IMZ44_17410, partial [Planctomycetes bacterium]|nr:hypothetical protein [Planctomycetota bacterium]